VYYIFYAPELVALFHQNPADEYGLVNMILDALQGVDFDGLMGNWQFGPDHELDAIGRHYATLIKRRIPDTPKVLFEKWDCDEAVELWGDDGATLYLLDNASIMVAYNPDLKGSMLKDLNIPHEIYPRGV